MWNKEGRMENGVVGRCWPDHKSQGVNGLSWTFLNDVIFISEDDPINMNRTIRIQTKFLVRNAIMDHIKRLQ